MIRSMTGYSSVRSEEADFSLSVNLKSTNHRFLDMQVRMPSALEQLEPHLRRLVKNQIARGHVDITVTLEWAASGELHVDRRLLGAYASACQQLRNEFGTFADPDPVALLRIPGVVAGNSLDISRSGLERLQQALECVANQALARLNEMRAGEGEVLERDLYARMEKLERLGESIDVLAQSMAAVFQRRLEQRVRDMLGNLELDPSRFAQEVVFLASRADIAEEVTRFRSHVEQAKRLLRESSEVGKKLDFLLQEMNREANTLLSKTGDAPEVGLEIARHAIEMKTEIEKLREQAQNIE
jgi:uncharacterized protein (TIGR00255 family)